MTSATQEAVSRLLDIHTHRPENCRHAILNLSLSAVSPSRGDNHQPCDDCLYSAGIHPCELSEDNAAALWERVEEWCAYGRIAAIGETGLDKRAESPMTLQADVFRRHAELAEACRLPLIIHCVRAMEELLEVRKSLSPLRQAWIWHGFRGKPEQARQLLNAGFYLSFGAHYSEDTLRMMPPERLLLETDDNPADIGQLLRRASEIRRTEPESLRETIRRNVRDVFFRE